LDCASLLNYFYDCVLPAAESVEELKVFLSILRSQMMKRSSEVIVDDRLAFFLKSTGMDPGSIRKGIEECTGKGLISLQEVNGRGAAMSILMKDHMTHDHVRQGDKKIHDHEITCMDNDVIDLLTGYFGFSISFARRLVTKYGEERVREKVREFKYIKDNNIYLIGNPAGYLRKSIEENYPAPPGYEGTVRKMERKKTRKERQEMVNEARTKLGAAEMEEITREAEKRLEKDVGRVLGRIPKAALDAYVSIIIGERLGIDIAA